MRLCRLALLLALALAPLLGAALAGKGPDPSPSAKKAAPRPKGSPSGSSKRPPKGSSSGGSGSSSSGKGTPLDACPRPDSSNFCNSLGFTAFRTDCDGDGKPDWACAAPASPAAAAALPGSSSGSSTYPAAYVFAAALSAQPAAEGGTCSPATRPGRQAAPLVLRDSELQGWYADAADCRRVLTPFLTSPPGDARQIIGQCPSAGSGFTLLPDLDASIPGAVGYSWMGHITSFLQLPAPSAAFSGLPDLVTRTAEACRSMPDCAAFNARGWLVAAAAAPPPPADGRPTPSGRWWAVQELQGGCLYLKVPESGTVCTTPPSGYRVQPDVDRVGGDVHAFYGKSVAELRAECDARPLCTGFKTRAEGYDQAQGWIKYDVRGGLGVEVGHCVYERLPVPLNGDALRNGARVIISTATEGSTFDKCVDAAAGQEAAAAQQQQPARVVQRACDPASTSQAWYLEAVAGSDGEQCFTVRNTRGQPLAALKQPPLSRQWCLGVAAPATAAGADVVAGPCTGADSQAWCFKAAAAGVGAAAAAGSEPPAGLALQVKHMPGLCLGVQGGSSEDGAQLQLGACDGGSTAEIFYVAPCTSC